jgi:uncharacterized membrane protein
MVKLVQDEVKVLLVYTFILSVISIASFYLVPLTLTSTGSIYADYYAIIYSNLTLIEKYVYYVSEAGKTMLYRYWDAPLYVVNDSSLTGDPYILLLGISCPDNAIGYVKDARGDVHVFTPLNENTISLGISGYINSVAFNNEAGCYFPSGVPLGEHVVEFTFKLVPPINIDSNSEYAHLNLMLADEHVPYRFVKIELNGFKPYKLFVHIPELEVKSYADNVLITGSVPGNTLLEVELVFPKSNIGSASYIPLTVDDMLSRVDKANANYYYSYSALRILYYAVAAVLLVYPIYLVTKYFRVGREKEYIVPEYVSYVPNPSRKPWEVNLLFYKDVLDMDENALYSTIMDFAKRGIIEIRRADSDDVVLYVKEQRIDTLDIYETRVYRFLKSYASNGVFSFKSFSQLLELESKANPRSARRYFEEIKSIMGVFPEAKKYARRFIEPRKPVSLLTIFIVFVVFTGSLTLLSLGREYGLYPLGIVAFNGVLVLEVLVSYTMPSYVYGRWREDYYREKLEWQGFRNLLKDLAKLNQYAPQDLIIWKDWLIYATALGVADKVVEAMSKIGLKAPVEAYVPIYARPIMVHTMRVITSSSTSSRTGARGGGFGARGGFGGGGGGVR